MDLKEEQTVEIKESSKNAAQPVLPAQIPDQPGAFQNPEEQAAQDLAKPFAQRYRLLKKLGSGGMSTVYEAEHLHLNKTFALKLLHQSKDEASLLRFQQEAKAASSLEHPNIVKVHDFGVSEGQPFMIMDCLRGKSLAEMIKTEGPLELKPLSRIFIQICSALAHAHEEGIVHRDIKPSNIVFSGDDPDSASAVLVDFGIAKVTEQKKESAADALTRTGDIFGTPQYMSPEQCQGQTVDPRSDIYSLGCVIYEAFTGKPPFAGENVYQLIHKQINEAPPPFPEELSKSPRCKKLEALVLKAMAKCPDDRYKFVLEMSSELKSIEFSKDDLKAGFSAYLLNFNRRLKATERQTVLLDWTSRLTPALALLLSAVLFLLPGQISSLEIEKRRQMRVVSLCQIITSERFKHTNQNFYDLPVNKYNKALERYCHNNPEQLRLFNIYQESSARTAERVAKLKEAVGDGVGGLNLQMLQDVRRSMLGVVSSWSETNQICTSIMQNATSISAKLQERLNVLWLIEWLSLALSFPLFLTLLAGIRRNIVSRSELSQGKNHGGDEPNR